MKISIITPTVLGDFPVWEEPHRHVLDYVPMVIEQQDFDFDQIEVVIIDALWRWRKDYFASHSYPFEIIHAPPAASWVIKNRKTNHAVMRNTGLALASGELIFLVDDTLSFDSNMLNAIWAEYKAGHCISPLVEWRCGEKYSGANVDWRVDWLLEQSITRFETSAHENGALKPIGFGIISYPLEAALDLGGYDELLDAGLQHVDTEFGVRLASFSSYSLTIDARYWCRHEAHELPDPRVVVSYDPVTHTSSMFHGAIHCNRQIYEIRKRIGFPKVVNESFPPRELYDAVRECPFFVKIDERPIDTDGAPPNQSCAASNLPCKVPHLAVKRDMREVDDWVKNLRTFNLRAWRKTVREQVGIE